MSASNLIHFRKFNLNFECKHICWKNITQRWLKMPQVYVQTLKDACRDRVHIQTLVGIGARRCYITVLHIIKLTWFPVIFRFRSGSGKLKLCRNFTIYFDFKEHCTYSTDNVFVVILFVYRTYIDGIFIAYLWYVNGIILSYRISYYLFNN